MRVAQRVLAVFVVFGWVFGIAGVAQARPVLAPVPPPPGVAVTPYALCVYGGVEVTNTSGASIKVRVELDGAPLGGSGWTDVASGGGPVRFSGYAPPPPGVYSVYLQDGGNEDLIAEIPFVKPAFCGLYTFTWVDHCTSLDVTMKNNGNSAVEVNFTKLSGATFPVLLSNIPLAAGEQKTINIPVTDVDPADPDPKPAKPWYDLAPRVIPPNEFIEIHPIKGTNGTGCAPIESPTPSPATTPVPATSAPEAGLPSTGTKLPWQALGFGVAFLVLGTLAVVVSRRVRARA